jgi:hypothetical protein
MLVCWFRLPLDVVKPGLAPDATAFGALAFELLQPAITKANAAATIVRRRNRSPARWLR